MGVLHGVRDGDCHFGVVALAVPSDLLVLEDLSDFADLGLHLLLVLVAFLLKFLLQCLDIIINPCSFILLFLLLLSFFLSHSILVHLRFTIMQFVRGPCFLQF